MSHCIYDGGPPMSHDVVGIGVRISFYLQTLALACLSLRSPTFYTIAGSIYPLIVTSLAMVVAGLIVGLRSQPEISFHDALVMFYLLYLSWAAVCYTSRQCTLSSHDGVRMLQVTCIFYSYIIFAFALVLLITAESFGNTPECNRHAVIVLFRPFPAFPQGWIIGWTLTFIVFVIYTFMITGQTWRRIPLRWKLPIVEFDVPADPESEVTRSTEVSPQALFRDATLNSSKSKGQSLSHELPIAWDVAIQLVLIVVFWSLTVLNTELLIKWNCFAPANRTQSFWQYGQILPVFVVVLPVLNMIKAFRDFAFRPLDRAYWEKRS